MARQCAQAVGLDAYFAWARCFAHRNFCAREIAARAFAESLRRFRITGAALAAAPPSNAAMAARTPSSCPTSCCSVDFRSRTTSANTRYPPAADYKPADPEEYHFFSSKENIRAES